MKVRWTSKRNESALLHFRGARIIQPHSVNLTGQNPDPGAYGKTVVARKVFCGEIIKNCGATLIVSAKY